MAIRKVLANQTQNDRQIVTQRFTFSEDAMRFKSGIRMNGGKAADPVWNHFSGKWEVRYTFHPNAYLGVAINGNGGSYNPPKYSPPSARSKKRKHLTKAEREGIATKRLPKTHRIGSHGKAIPLTDNEEWN